MDSSFPQELVDYIKRYEYSDSCMTDFHALSAGQQTVNRFCFLRTVYRALTDRVKEHIVRGLGKNDSARRNPSVERECIEPVSDRHQHVLPTVKHVGLRRIGEPADP